MTSDKTIYVYENYSKLEPVFIGTVFVNVSKGEEVYLFSYDDEYLKENKNDFLLDPNIMLYSGRQFASIDKKTFGILEDSSPDR
ncbi:MAG: hypothetical protein MJ246_08145 [Clostridia bacterium]|nr:hypothetical protein [Clostridia bacterium]